MKISTSTNNSNLVPKGLIEEQLQQNKQQVNAELSLGIFFLPYRGGNWGKVERVSENESNRGNHSCSANELLYTYSKNCAHMKSKMHP